MNRRDTVRVAALAGIATVIVGKADAQSGVVSYRADVTYRTSRSLTESKAVFLVNNVGSVDEASTKLWDYFHTLADFIVLSVAIERFEYTQL